MTNECEWRKEIDGIGICGLHILPCAMVKEKGLCEHERDKHKRKQTTQGV